MVFSSIPAYLDPPIWQQQPNQHEANRTESPHHQLVPPLHQQPHAPHVGGGAGSIIRPGSIADRAQAQLAKIPAPEAALKCPRCESTNTKFCYFNNYSLSQPRHFCKTCRRYWTRGGALRNVPVGGGFRRNKKNKRTRSKSPASNDKESSLSNSTSVQIGQFPQSITNRPYMTSIQNLSRYGVGNIGLNLREIQAQTGHMGFQIGGHCSTADEGGVDQWRFQQFPFLNGFESTSAVSYPFQSEIVEAPSGLVGDVAATSRVTQLPSAKLEYNGGLNLLRSPLSISENNHYNSWTDLSALASSSATHLL